MIEHFGIGLVRHSTCLIYTDSQEELIRMLTSKEKDDLLAVERGLFPDDADLGRVDTRKATILGQAWVKSRRAEIQREQVSLV